MRTITARWFTPSRIERIRLIVIHDMEAPEGPLTAENVAQYFASTDTKASAHVCADNNSRVRCVPDVYTAWAAPGANADGLQLELAGYMRQSREQWLDEYSRGALDQGAQQVAEWCRLHDLPPRQLTRAELRAGLRGITSHVDVSEVYQRSDHTDPGPNFPWGIFLALVHTYLGDAEPPAEEETVTAPTWPGRVLRLATPLMEGNDVRRWQRQMRARGWSIDVDGIYGRASERTARAFQEEKGLVVDGMVGAVTWRTSWEAEVT
ncbi:peptidoglycan-binding domain-containing protein [Streptosporangium sp. NPDC051023]|uniref:peptidoglycan recognition protein family protein n=1 Tax=Streptosporangium sp. NPDC051023 TaxID=3155410 RepID=UPI00344CFC41